MSEELTRVERIFDAALELASVEQRTAYLEAACGADTSLRRRVEKLLRAHETAGLFLSPDTPHPTCLPVPAPDAAPLEQPGDHIGPYTVLERIGEGGTCVVYLAEQTHPIRREVALKLIKPGMDTRQVVARFEVERQALALMDHPHIAKVFDAGVTASGRPYFVMERVRGEPITQYCDRHGLMLKQRLELFVQVCHAVQHAHQKGIIHRDLKPSNILVTADGWERPPAASSCDAVGEHRPKAVSAHRPAEPPERGRPRPQQSDGPGDVAADEGARAPVLGEATRAASEEGRPPHSPARPLPKIIDFGIAKATQARLTGQATVTWVGQFLGTPAYMSPEQAAMNNEDIDVRSDIYALGTLLYELLTGVTPFDQETLAKASFDEIRRTIQEVEPPKPSARLRGNPASPRSGIRNPKWQEVRGDLDWIVTKALEKDRQRRYASANEMAEDVLRHLAHEPVSAGPPGARYRVRKFVRRHRVGVTVGAVITLALLAGLSLALVGLQRAVQAEVASRQERDRAVAAEGQMRVERDRAVQAEADARRMLDLFSDKLVADDELIGLLHAAAQLARENLGPTNPAALKVLLPLAPNFGRLGAWTNALDLYLSLIEADPANSDYWQCAHAAALAAAQPEVSRRLRQGMVDRFAASQDLTDRLRLAKALLLTPEDTNHLETAIQCARRAAQAHPRDASCRTVMGMAEYRQGNCRAALEWLQEAERSDDPNLATVAFCFGAMARQRLGQASDAPEALSRAWRQLRVPLETGQLVAKDWQEVVFGFVACAEAERLVCGRELSPRVTARLLAQAREKWKSVREPLTRGEGHARQGKWRESRDAYVEALAHPSFDWGMAERQSPMRCLSLHMGTAFARAGDSTNHQRLCRLLLALHTQDPQTSIAERTATVDADRYAKTCFLNAGVLSPELRQKALDLARFAVTNCAKRKDGHPGWVAQTAGIAEYHAGDQSRALQLLQEAEKDENVFVKGPAMAYHSMALRKLNRVQEAATLLREAEQLHAAAPATDPSLYWWDAEQFHLAIEAAREQIRPPGR